MKIYDDSKYRPVIKTDKKFDGIRVVNANVDELMCLRQAKIRVLQSKRLGGADYDRAYPDQLTRNVFISARHSKALVQARIPKPDLQILQQQEIDGKIQVYEGGAPELGAMKYYIPWHKIKELPAYFQVLVPNGFGEGHGRARVKTMLQQQADSAGFVCRFITTGEVMTVTIVDRKDPVGN